MNAPINYVRYSKNYFYDILVGEILIYDASCRIVSRIIDPDIEQFNSSIAGNDKEWIMLLSKRNSERKLISEFKIISNERVLYQNRYCGKILSHNFLIHFKYDERFKPSNFRCSDLMDTTTYWEYTCPTGLQASNTWVVRGEYLLFCENTDGSYQGNIKKIHLPTGELKWEAAVPMTRLHYNESQGLFISFWANVDYGQYYQIIDIDNETIDFGNPITDVILQNLPSTEGTLYLYERKLYFTDFSNAYGDQIPKIMFGFFDIDTKEVEFLQEVPEAKGDGFAQIIYSDNKLYLRSFGNKLYVYEHEITAS